MESDEPTPASCLKGIKVLDFTRHLVAYSTMVIADYGADVVKVESAPKGDPHRYSGPTFVNDESAWFLTWNRGKRSICIDLRNPEAKSVLHRLVAQADVLIHNFRPDIPKLMGIDWETVHALNPGLVYVWISGLGSKGPWKDRAAGDHYLQAMSGLMSVTGEPGRLPVTLGVPFGSFTSAMVAAQAILLGLLGRSSTGKGQFFEVPMLSVMLASLTDLLGPYFVTGEDPVPMGSQHSGVAPLQVFETADGYAFAGSSALKWESFCKAIGLPDLADDSRFVTNVDRIAHRDELTEILAEHFLQRTNGEWDRVFEEHSLPFSAVNKLSQILNSEHVRANEMTFEVAHPTAGILRHVSPMIRSPKERGGSDRPAPLLGEHNEEILGEFGFERDEIEALGRQGVIR